MKKYIINWKYSCEGQSATVEFAWRSDMMWISWKYESVLWKRPFFLKLHYSLNEGRLQTYQWPKYSSHNIQKQCCEHTINIACRKTFTKICYFNNLKKKMFAHSKIFGHLNIFFQKLYFQNIARLLQFFTQKIRRP